MKSLLLVLLLCLPLAAGELHIDPSAEYQTMDGIGACTYCFMYNSDGSGGNWDWNAVKFVFDELDLHYFRTAPWLSWWETANDNIDPYSINWNGFQTANRFADWREVPYGEYLSNRGYELNLGVWSFESWLANGNPVQIAPDMYDELGETLASYVIYQTISNNVNMPVYEIQNEPAINAAIRYASPETLVTAALEVITMMDHFGLTNMILHGPNHHQPSGAAEWAAKWFTNAALRARTSALTYHTWWGQDFAYYDDIRKVAEQYNVPVWANEVSGMYWHPVEKQWHASYTNWACAFDGALRYWRAIVWSRASRTYHWTILGHDAVVSMSGERYPLFYVLKHMANHIPPGAVLVDSFSDDSSVYPMVFSLTNDEYAAIVINDRSSAVDMTITTNSTLSLLCRSRYTSTQGSYYQAGGPVYPDNGTLTLTLPADSISSINLAPVPEPAAAVATTMALLYLKWLGLRPGK
jgi:hypothetical protein